MKSAIIYVKQLEGAGLSREQAEAHVQIITEVIEGELATKQDLEIAKQELKILINEGKNDLADFRTEVNHRFVELESRLVLKTGAMLTVAAGLVVALIKLA